MIILWLGEEPWGTILKGGWRLLLSSFLGTERNERGSQLRNWQHEALSPTKSLCIIQGAPRMSKEAVNGLILHKYALLGPHGIFPQNLSPPKGGYMKANYMYPKGTCTLMNRLVLISLMRIRSVNWLVYLRTPNALATDDILNSERLSWVLSQSCCYRR